MGKDEDDARRSDRDRLAMSLAKETGISEA